MSAGIDLEPRRPSLWRRLLLGAAVLAALMIGLAVAANRGQQSRTAKRFQAAIDTLDEAEPGWRLEEIEAAHPAPPAPQNSALVVERAFLALPKGYVAADLDETPAGLARLDAELAKVAAALAEARRLTAMPEGKHEFDRTAPPVLWRWGFLDHVRVVSTLCLRDTVRLTHRNDPKNALTSWRAALNATRSLGDEAITGAYLTRYFGVAEALAGLQRVLALTTPADEDLAEVAELLRREEAHPASRAAFRAACAELHATFVWLEGNPPRSRGFDALFKTSEGYEEWRDGVLGVSAGELRRHHAAALELLASFADVLRLPPHEQAAREADYDRDSKPVLDQHRFARMLLPRVATVNKLCRRKLGQVRAMLTLLQAERHRLRHGAWPDALDGPLLDPHDGKPVRYKRLADGVVCYVLGENGRDDGGAIDRRTGGGPPADDGYRLPDPDKRRR